MKRSLECTFYQKFNKKTWLTVLSNMVSNRALSCNHLKKKKNEVNEEAFRRPTLDKDIYKSATDD